MQFFYRGSNGIVIFFIVKPERLLFLLELLEPDLAKKPEPDLAKKPEPEPVRNSPAPQHGSYLDVKNCMKFF